MAPHLGGHLDGEAGASNCARVMCLSYLEVLEEEKRSWPRLTQWRCAGFSAAPEGYEYLNTECWIRLIEKSRRVSEVRFFLEDVCL